MTRGFELACLDLAGTTVRDEGVVLAAFREAIEELQVDPATKPAMEQHVQATMGRSKIEVFTELFGPRAAFANDAFERSYEAVVRRDGAQEVPGAAQAVASLRAQGLAACATTGFSPSTRDTLLDALGWAELFDFVVSPADAGRGRPAPDMLLVCALRARVTAVDAIVVVGDTWSDMAAGRRVGAGLCVGVRSGADGDARLLEGGADVVLDSVAALPGALAARAAVLG